MTYAATVLSGEEISAHHVLPDTINITQLDNEHISEDLPVDMNSFLITPLVLYETDHAYLVYIDIGKCISSELEITVKYQMLQVRCNKKSDCDSSNAAGWFCWCKNMNMGILLPRDADTHHIQATQQNGLLTVAIDKH